MNAAVWRDFFFNGSLSDGISVGSGLTSTLLGSGITSSRLFVVMVLVGLITMARVTAVSASLLRLLVRKLVSLKSVRGNNLCNLSISFEGAVKVSLHGTSMPPCDRSALYCLAPVTSQEATPPLLINAEQAAEIIRGTWPTTTPPCNVATA